MHEEGQLLPVRMYQTEDRLMIAAPMPGLEPENISVSIEGDRLSIHGEERGPHQHDLDLLLAEWTVGPYFCEVEVGPNQRGVPAEFRLEALDSTRGRRVGHRGRTIRPAGPRQAA
jgi:hypothetical protein